MGLRWRGDVYHLGRTSSKRLRGSLKCRFTRIFQQLFSHQFFLVADSDDLAAGDPLDLRSVRVCDLAAPNNFQF